METPGRFVLYYCHPRPSEARGRGPRHLNSYYVYVLASRRNGTLYIGVTNDMLRRAAEHKSKQVPGFTRRHAVDILVWYDLHNDIATAIEREKQIKGWNRNWKIRLVEKMNPEWDDLYPHILS